MKIVYFSSSQEPLHQDTLLSAIRQAMPMVEVITFIDCHTFSEWLRVPPRNFFAAILNPGNERSLCQLIPLRGLLIDRKIIVILPDTHERNLPLVHIFRPHHIQWMQDDSSTLIAILHKWLAAFQGLDQPVADSTPAPH